MLNSRRRTEAQGGVIVSHAGRQHAYHTALALQTADTLNLFLTSSYYKRDQYPDRFARLVPGLDRWLERRYQEGLDPARVRRFPMLELPEVAYRLLKGNDRYTAELVQSRDRRFDRIVSELLPELNARAFWGFQGSSSLSVRAARDAEMKTIVEYASIPDEIARMLLAQDDYPPQLQSRDRLRSEQQSEFDPANAAGAPDIYIAASSFSAQCLGAVGVPDNKIKVIPLGADVSRFKFQRRDPCGPLKVLFVGKLARHKGIHYLLDAVKILHSQNIQVSFVGPSVGDDSLMTPFKHLFTAMGTLEGAALVQAFHDHDVLVVPSLYDGFGLVILEAMATGMPVIATENSCAPDIIREGLDGFVVPTRDATAIAGRLDWCAGNKVPLVEMGYNAASRAREYSWERYGERVGHFIFDVLVQAHESTN